MADECIICDSPNKTDWFTGKPYEHTCGKIPEGVEKNGHLFYETCQCKFCVRCMKPACWTLDQCPVRDKSKLLGKTGD